MAAMIMQNSTTAGTVPKSHDNTHCKTAMAATIMQNSTQGGVRIANEYQGLIFFEMSSGLGLTRYVSGHLSTYGNGISIYV